MSDKYSELKAQGLSLIDIYKQMKADGLSNLDVIKPLRQMFGLSLVEAKGIMIEATTSDDLNTYQEKVADWLDSEIANPFPNLQ